MYEQVKREYKYCSCGKKLQKHIYKEGGRHHVMFWDMNGGHCVEKGCEINHICSKE